MSNSFGFGGYECHYSVDNKRFRVVFGRQYDSELPKIEILIYKPQLIEPQSTFIESNSSMATTISTFEKKFFENPIVWFDYDLSDIFKTHIVPERIVASKFEYNHRGPDIPIEFTRIPSHETHTVDQYAFESSLDNFFHDTLKEIQKYKRKREAFKEYLGSL